MVCEILIKLSYVIALCIVYKKIIFFFFKLLNELSIFSSLFLFLILIFICVILCGWFYDCLILDFFFASFLCMIRRISSIEYKNTFFNITCLFFDYFFYFFRNWNYSAICVACTTIIMFYVLYKIVMCSV